MNNENTRFKDLVPLGILIGVYIMLAAHAYLAAEESISLSADGLYMNLYFVAICSSSLSGFT